MTSWPVSLRPQPLGRPLRPRGVPHECCVINANDYFLRKNNTFPSSAGAPARLVGRAPSSTIRTHLAPTAQPPVALAGAVTLLFPACFWPISSRIGFLTEIRGTEPQCCKRPAAAAIPARANLAKASGVSAVEAAHHECQADG